MALISCGIHPGKEPTWWLLVHMVQSDRFNSEDYIARRTRIRVAFRISSSWHFQKHQARQELHTEEISYGQGVWNVCHKLTNFQRMLRSSQSNDLTPRVLEVGWHVKYHLEIFDLTKEDVYSVSYEGRSWKFPLRALPDIGTDRQRKRLYQNSLMDWSFMMVSKSWCIPSLS